VAQDVVFESLILEFSKFYGETVWSTSTLDVGAGRRIFKYYVTPEFRLNLLKCRFNSLPYDLMLYLSPELALKGQLHRELKLGPYRTSLRAIPAHLNAASRLQQ